MAESPLADAEGPVRVAVFSNGVALGDDAQLVSVTVQRTANKMPSAQLVFVDGDMAEGAFPLSDQPTLIPGVRIQVKAGYGDEEQKIFEGVVVKHSIRIGSHNDARLVVDCLDKAVEMSVGPNVSSRPLLQVTWGTDLMSLDAEIAHTGNARDLAPAHGRMSFQGSAKAKLGGLIRLVGVGKRFSGDVLVSGLRHEISDGHWVTDAEFGLPSEQAHEQPGVMAPAAPGLLPGIQADVNHAKLKVELDETNGVITVTTPANNRIVLSDKDQSILLIDQNDNKVGLNPGGVTIETLKDIKATAKGTITLDAVGGVRISSQSDAVKVSGQNVSCEAQVGFVGKGNASAELSASGQTVVRGALVMIN